MNDEFMQNALSWGDDGALWLKRIPEIISHYEKKWSIRVSSPYKLSYNYVAPVVRSDGTQAVLKIGYPKDKEFQTEIDALHVFHGDGIEKILEADKENAVILIEQLSPGVPLSTINDDDEATQILASVMKQLWKPTPTNHSFIAISEWTKDLFNVRNWYKGTTGPFPEHLIDKAQTLFKHLIATQKNPVLVHGDLHHDNVLSSYRGTWLAIDPKGIIAEPCYEAAAMIRNPYEKLKNVSDLRPILQKRIMILSEVLHYDPERVAQWCFAQTMLSAVWNMNGVKGGEHALRVAEALDTLRASN